MGYGAWLHGQAVGCGMVMAALLSHKLGLVEMAFVDRLRHLIEAAGLPVVGPVLDTSDNAGRYLSLMRLDKKAEAGEIKFVVIDGPGHAAVRAASDAMVREVIDACCLPR
jgi:3-dehydroquinate synthase